MQKSKVFMLTLLFSFMAGIALNANSIIKNPDAIRKEITQYISDIDLTEMETESERVTIQFVVNKKNQIIVVDVDNEKFDIILKSRLNYQTLKTTDVEQNTVITVPLVFEKRP